MACVAACCGIAAAQGAYVRLHGAVGDVLPTGCSAAGAAPAFTATFDLGPDGAWRYSPAWVVPLFFDDEGEFNLLDNSDVTLEISPYRHAPRGPVDAALPTTPLSSWLAAFDRLPEQTTLAMRVATYDARGATVAMSRITWNCSTGAVLSVVHRGNAAIAAEGATMPVVEYHHAGLDHWLVTADPAEMASLDAGRTAGWARTGLGFPAWRAGTAGTQPVCRFYLPPAFGDSHFLSASTDECATVAARFPGFVYESADVFDMTLPAVATGACPAGTRPVYRLWNGRADSNHRYTTDRDAKAAMLARGYVAEGYGPDAVAMCAAP
jgi:hypothetical protein